VAVADTAVLAATDSPAVEAMRTPADRIQAAAADILAVVDVAMLPADTGMVAVATTVAEAITAVAATVDITAAAWVSEFTARPTTAMDTATRPVIAARLATTISGAIGFRQGAPRIPIERVRRSLRLEIPLPMSG
jgi:hypothetical protein